MEKFGQTINAHVIENIWINLCLSEILMKGGAIVQTASDQLSSYVDESENHLCLNTHFVHRPPKIMVNNF